MLFFSPPSALPGISPTRGEIGCSRRSRWTMIAADGDNALVISFDTREVRGICRGSISPLVGEMVGRPEGGNPEHFRERPL